VANTNLSLVGLDFEKVRDNLKTYLKRSESPFKDVDFEGSNISHLIDVLSYNTYLNSFYLNMVASEMFLDTALLRDSVISHAKELNYVPRSYISAQAKVSFYVTPTGAVDTLSVPKGTSFTTKVGSNSFTFTTSEASFYTANSTGYINVNDLTIYEGSYTNDTFVYDYSNTQIRFVLSDNTIDTRSLTVAVYENNGANIYSYTRATTFLDKDATSQIYFIQAAENGQYELIFGDDVIGRRPRSGSVILAEYRTSSGAFPNGAGNFTIDGPISGQANISLITTVDIARGGGESESLSSIKYNAPRSYQNQDRAITPGDYENILLANFPEIQAVSAFGGEDADPPQFGRVFISTDIVGSDGTSSQDKNRFLDFIKTRCAIGIEPVFIDPEFLYLDIVCNIQYNTNVTNMLPDSISSIVRNTILDYNTTYLENFKRTYRHSKLQELINTSTPSIVGVELNAYPNIRISPTLNTNYTSTLYFGFALDKFYSLATLSEDYIKSNVKAVYSSKFTYNSSTCTLQDDGNGNIGIYRTDTAGNSVFVKNTGTVDYDSGIVKIVDLNISGYPGSAIHVHVNAVNIDVSASRNKIIKISSSDIEVNVTPVRE